MHKPLCQNNKCNTTLTGQFTAPLCALSTVTFDFEVEEKRKKKKQLDAHLGHSLLATEIKNNHSIIFCNSSLMAASLF